MFSKIVLALWSGAELIWWTLAWRLVAADHAKGRMAAGDPAPRRSLSVFKPLPPLGAKGLSPWAAGVESFVAQLDPESELLLGIHEADRAATGPFLERMRTEYPGVRLKVVFRSEPDDMANPKISWQKILAPQAAGELWLWSDADIIAPPEFLRTARREFEPGGASMLTYPYVVREIPSPPALLAALFVNAEFYPGVLLLRKLGTVDFGLGAAMLFRRDDFLHRIDWRDLGSVLADDFLLGQKLGPVRIGTTTLTTVADDSDWKEAFRHDLRWARTIRWNRPLGSAARIAVLPVLGWLGYVAWHPSHFFAWVGLLGMIQADVLFAAALCRQSGCRLEWRNLPAMEWWSLWRIILWLLCWLPGSVVWSGKTWRRPREI